MKLKISAINNRTLRRLAILLTLPLVIAGNLAMVLLRAAKQALWWGSVAIFAFIGAFPVSVYATCKNARDAWRLP